MSVSLVRGTQGKELDTVVWRCKSILRKALEATGVRRDDPRIKETLRNLEQVAGEGKDEGKEEDDYSSIDNLVVNLSTFKRFVPSFLIFVGITQNSASACEAAQPVPYGLNQSCPSQNGFHRQSHASMRIEYMKVRKKATSSHEWSHDMLHSADPIGWAWSLEVGVLPVKWLNAKTDES